MKHHRTAPRRSLSLLALLAPALLPACGGGGGGSSNPTLSQPSTGAVWGGTRTIRWTANSTDGGTAQILLSDDGGATFATTIAASTPDDGSYTFDSTTFSDDEDYRVRIVLSNGRTLGSGDFAIDNTAPVTTLTSPVGTEILGGTPTVTWTTNDVHPGTVEIRLSTDDGATYPTVIEAATPDDGTYEWNASALVDGTQYRLQITPTDEASNAGASSESAQSFELDNTAPIIQLTSPNGGEAWSGAQSITWTTTETNPSTVTLTLSEDSGATFGETIATNVPDNGTYSWATGEAPDGTLLRVRAVARDLAGNVSTPDVSDADFTITNLRINGPAHYLDTNQSGSIDAGDELYLRFDKNVTVNAPAAGDFDLEVTGDTFGAGASVAAGPELDSVVVTLGANPTLRTRGLFDSGAVTSGRPSGMDVSASMTANAIEATGTGIDAVPSGTKDIRPTFVPVSTGVTTTGVASAVVAGDFDQDGDVDFVIGESSGVGLTLLYGDGAGGFTSAVGDTVVALDLVAGDIDGDGLLDLVLANGTAVRTATGVGGGAFAAFGAPFGAGTARAVALGDLDADGDLDLFVGHTSGGADRVLLNDGAGSFTATGQSLGSGNTESVAVGDLDGDCDLDVVAASNAGGQPVRAWLNNGSGSFTAGDAITITQAQDVALGDLDGDGDLDVAVGVLGQNEILLNDGTGTFGTTAQFFGNNDNRGIVLIDLDGDGDLDVGTVKYLDGERWWFNDGTGTVTESLVRGLADDAVGVAAARIDADGDEDLFVAVDGTAHRVYLSSASGGQPAATFADAGATIPLLASSSGISGDFDRDGALDVALSIEGGAPRILYGDAAGTFTAGTAFGASDFVLQAAVDIDCDGDLDLAGYGAADPTSWSFLMQGANGTFSNGATNLPAVISGFVDVDRDGDLDFIGADVASLPSLWLNDGDGEFSDSGADLGNTTAEAASAADMDGDGDLDVVLSDAMDLRVLEHDGALGFTAAYSSNATSYDGHAVADLDADGDLDILQFTVTTPLAQTRYIAVLNDGGLTFTPQAPTGALVQTEGVRLVDIDEDGALDIVSWRTTGTPAYHLHFGNGAGAFSFDSTNNVSNLAQVLVGDFDHDGDPDLYLACYDAVGSAAAQHLLYARD